MPEALHVELTGDCPLDCPSCYLEREPGPNLTWARLEEVLREAIDLGVLQVAFGGGEPLAVSLLEDAVRLAAAHGLGVSVTTSGFGADRAMLTRLRVAGLDHLQVSVSEHATTRDARLGAAPWSALEAAAAVGLGAGVNVIASSFAIDSLPALVAAAVSAGARAVNLLRPKPPARGRDGWFERARLRGADWRRLAVALSLVRAEYPAVRITLDSALSPVVGLLPSRDRPRPTSGCAAGRRFMAVDRRGRFAPCSHLTAAERSGSIEAYWRYSEELAALRGLEEAIGPGCRECPDLHRCRGCRAIADGIAADPDCWRRC